VGGGKARTIPAIVARAQGGNPAVLVEQRDGQPVAVMLFGYTNVQLGLIASSSEIAYAIGKFINGPLADRMVGRKMFLLGMFRTDRHEPGLLADAQDHGIHRHLVPLPVLSVDGVGGGLTKSVGAWFPLEPFPRLRIFHQVS
jgi:MFS family permease